MKNPIDLEKKHLMQTYARYPLVIERGKGCWVWDTKGNKYLDFVAGLGVSALGHGHPRILKALREQAARVIHVSNLYYHSYQGPLAAALAKVTGLDRAFFCNSGTEAVEGALKLARARASRLSKEKFEIVALDNSFHGRTIGALSATGQAKYRQDFEPLVPGFRFVRFNDVADLTANVSDRTCAVIVDCSPSRLPGDSRSGRSLPPRKSPARSPPGCTAAPSAAARSRAASPSNSSPS
jgi:acetylornithine/succinyldiaminopimelate/putrescine aminotransferase